MMLPARTVSLPNFFTPRRLLWLSRPLRDEPPAFLCAMSNYFAFGVFLAAALAGAAFFVDPDSAFAGAAFLAAGLAAFAALGSVGAGLAVGFPAMSPAPSAGVTAPAALSFDVPAPAAFAGLSGVG